ncbi:MAG TPA: DUF167 domain-containing protein [Thermoplasmata archaeon]|nr:DUF167 domain-containing protein [Thermoplasmata archaeon]
MKSESYARGHGEFCTITVDASPGASRTEIVGTNPWRKALQVRIAAQAKDGEANAELVRFLAERLSVPASSVRILRGERSSLKIIQLPLPAERAQRLLRGD